MLANLLALGALASTALAAPHSTVLARGSQTTYAGVNIAGFDFGTQQDGSMTSNGYPPVSALGGPDGIGQMKHFATDRGLNMFRLPVGWQYLTAHGSDPTKLDPNALGEYDLLVKGCLATGAKCIIDLHNYARYNGGIVGQGGPSNDQFASFWAQMAGRYKGNNQIVYGIMNEPHDLDINTWATTVQSAVSAIRNTNGNTANLILLPGTAFTNAGGFVSDGSFAALSNVKNPDGSTNNLIFEVHQYLDSDSSGTHTSCVSNGVQGLQNIQTALAGANRQAILGETGGGPSDSSCLTDVCAELAFMNQNSGQFLGYVGWSAGSFDSTYELTLTPTNNGGTWTDVPLMKQCFARK